MSKPLWKKFWAEGGGDKAFTKVKYLYERNGKDVEIGAYLTEDQLKLTIDELFIELVPEMGGGS